MRNCERAQVRLCLDHEDYMRAQILAKKVNPKVFVEVTPEKKKKGSEAEVLVEVAGPDVPTLPELKVAYYHLMIRWAWLCSSHIASPLGSRSQPFPMSENRCNDPLCIALHDSEMACSSTKNSSSKMNFVE